MINKRKNGVLAVLIVILIIFSGCNAPSSNQPEDDATIIYQGCSVHYLDVGQGDCIFIRLSDGKNMLIDSGDKSDKICEYVIRYLENYSVKTINYFILTHPDLDHIGNALDVINNFEVEKVFIPYISDEIMVNFPEYIKVKDAISQKEIKTEISNSYTYINGSGYNFAFLSPLPFGNNGSSYDELNATLISTDSLINNLSPIIYFETENTRFIFTGDAGKSQENIVINNYKVGVYKSWFSRHGITVNLEDIDYLKVGHHGADDSSGREFLNLLRPKNAIISVGGNNYYGHPKTEVLERLMLANENYSLFRTDVHGTIVVHKNANGNFVTSTQSQQNKSVA
ncbi:MAG: MBL fold metallo-hydrolase [Clostridia bacterium]|nr:MBL fold metallo-hydrolase [Clostridia bacterium]